MTVRLWPANGLFLAADGTAFGFAVRRDWAGAARLRRWRRAPAADGALVVLDPRLVYRRPLRDPVHGRADLAALLPSYLAFEPETADVALGRDVDGATALVALPDDDRDAIAETLDRATTVLVAPPQAILPTVRDRVAKGRLWDLKPSGPALLPPGFAGATAMTAFTFGVVIAAGTLLWELNERRQGALTERWRETTTAAAPLEAQLRTTRDMTRVLDAARDRRDPRALDAMARVLSHLAADDHLRAWSVGDGRLEVVVMTRTPDRWRAAAGNALISAEVVDFPVLDELSLTVELERWLSPTADT
jgi:hypothetical protein